MKNQQLRGALTVIAFFFLMLVYYTMYVEVRTKNLEAEQTKAHSFGYNRTFIIVTGAEGSGTGFFATNLGKLSNAVFVPEHPDFTVPLPPDVSVEPFVKKNRVWNAFSGANHVMWGPGPLDVITKTKQTFPQLVQHLFESVYPQKQLLFGHRSMPDYDNLHYPDLSDELFGLFKEAGYPMMFYLISYRDPKASSFSKVRRNFTHIIPPGESKADLFMSSRSVEMHLTLMSAQLKNLHPNDYCVLSFDKFLENVRTLTVKFLKLQPEPGIRTLSQFLNVPEDQIAQVLTNSQKQPSDYRQALDPLQLRFLDEFFSTKRKMQWQFLESVAFSPWNS